MEGIPEEGRSPVSDQVPAMRGSGALLEESGTEILFGPGMQAGSRREQRKSEHRVAMVRARARHVDLRGRGGHGLSLIHI